MTLAMVTVALRHTFIKLVRQSCNESETNRQNEFQMHLGNITYRLAEVEFYHHL